MYLNVTVIDNFTLKLTCVIDKTNKKHALHIRLASMFYCVMKKVTVTSPFSVIYFTSSPILLAMSLISNTSSAKFSSITTFGIPKTTQETSLWQIV